MDGRLLQGRALLGSLVAVALLMGASARPAKAAGKPYDIHVIMPLTGGAAFLGKAQQQAIRLVEKEANKTGGINGRPVRIIFHDDQTRPQVAVQLANEVMALHPAVILGSSIVANCNAMAPLMENGPVMYCFSPGMYPRPASYVFGGDVATGGLAVALVRFFRLKGWTRLAMITSTDATGQDAVRRFKAALALPENSTMHMVEEVQFAPSDVSVAAQITRIKAAKPQMLIAWSTGAPVTTVFRGLIDGGLDLPVTTTDGNMTYTQMEQYAAFLPKQLYVPAGEWPGRGDPGLGLDPNVAQKQKEFYARFEEAGIPIDVGAPEGWDPTWIVIDALRKLGPDATAKQLRDYLARLKGFAGVNGVYDYERTPQRGLSADDAVVTRWTPQEKRWLPVSKPGGVPLEK